ncbi:MAG TPA: translation initiation factor IF-3 [Candidatus Paceibacterota bacterium]|nr:translation initiation factor IF-3 [Verrucomicrobiota bacterium]HSA09273.1 translation initiation factor IF-3 [Candidatus Paceibacterota bacterium]
MSRPFASRRAPAGPFIRVNGKIRAREVRVIGTEGNQLGVFSLGDALMLARAGGVDLVEIAPTANPPVCRLVDYGKFRFEQAKRDKDSKKHQHANKVKEVQLSPKIDRHDLGVKLQRAIEFLCEEMKVKVTLKFRGREMAHTEYGFEVIQDFLTDIAAYGHPDFEPKLVGRGIHVMISPLPRNKRAKAPLPGEVALSPPSPPAPARGANRLPGQPVQIERAASAPQDESRTEGFKNNPFAELDVNG